MLGNDIPGYRWVLGQIFTGTPWRAFLFVLIATVGIMLAWPMIWTGRLPVWSQLFKGFIIGDPLLGVIAALLNILNRRHPLIMPLWYWWMMALLGLVGAGLFIYIEFKQHKLTSVSELFRRPYLLYHHFGLFGTLIPTLAGAGIPLLVRHFGVAQVAVIVLFALYLVLNVRDAVHPPDQTTPPATWSVEAHLSPVILTTG